MVVQSIRAFFLVFTLCIVSCTSVQTDPRTLFVTDDRQPTPYVIDLLKLDGLYDPNDSLDDIVHKTQKNWIAVIQGKEGKERADLVDSPQRQQIYKQVFALTEQIGLFAERKPIRQNYRYGICLGAFLSGVRSRLADLVDAWQQGVRFESLVFLTGERYLRKGPGQQDDFAALCDPSLSPLPFKKDWQSPNLDSIAYETEYDMVRLVWDQVQLPEDMASALEGKVIFVNAPKGKAARPSTKDTYTTWLNEYHPEPGSIFVTSYPLIWSYQHLAAVNILGKNYPLDTAAKALSDDDIKQYYKAMVSLVFDTVAKCLYEIQRDK